MRSAWKLLLVLVVALALVSAAGCERAGSGKYPAKPIEVVIHSPAGDTGDMIARTIAEVLDKEKLLPQPMTVLNKTGGSGAVAFSYVVEKKGDPYTLLGTPPVFQTTPLTQGLSFGYKDFTPVANFVFDKTLVVVKADSPYKTINDLMDAAKKSPNSLSQGSGSITSMDNYIRGTLMKWSGAQWKYVSFEASNQAVTALLGGNVDFATPNPTEAFELIRAGRIRALVATRKVPALKDVPSMEELGIPFKIRHYRGMVAPSGIPADALKTLEDAIEKATKTERWTKYLAGTDMEPAFMKSAEYKKVLDDMQDVFIELTPLLGIQKK